MKFTRWEAALIVEGTHRCRYTDDRTKQSYLHGTVVDALDTYPALATKWVYDVDAVVKKLANLTEEQADEVLKRIGKFWEGAPHAIVSRACVDCGLAEEEL